MKDKIFNLLKQTYSSFGLSDDILQGQAEALANTGLVTDDNLQAVIDGQKPFLSSLQTLLIKRRQKRRRALLLGASRQRQNPIYRS